MKKNSSLIVESFPNWCIDSENGFLSERVMIIRYLLTVDSFFFLFVITGVWRRKVLILL